jgi:hypothetical protein
MLKDIFRGFFDPADATELVESFLARKRYSESFVDALRLLAELDRLGLEGIGLEALPCAKSLRRAIASCAHAHVTVLGRPDSSAALYRGLDRCQRSSNRIL